jgi:hypothetical protein
MDRLRDFKHIWDGTQPGWVVLRHTEDRERLKVMFELGASIHDLKANHERSEGGGVDASIRGDA